MLSGFAIGLLCKEARNRYHLFSRNKEGWGMKPWTELLVLRFKSSFVVHPNLTVSVDVRKAAAPVTEIGQSFVFKRHPLFFTIL